MDTYDCPPTLNDRQVIEFCANGFLMLEGIVPDEINRRTLEFVDAHPSGQPVEIMDESWFVENVICHPIAAGAVRSLLGKDFALPNLMANHRVECPQPAQEWHTDGGSKYGPELNYLQVFYYPQGLSQGHGADGAPAGLSLSVSAPTPASSLRGNQGLTLRSRPRRVDISDGLLDLAPPVGLSWHWDSKQPQVQLLEDHAA